MGGTNGCTFSPTAVLTYDQVRNRGRTIKREVQVTDVARANQGSLARPPRVHVGVVFAILIVTTSKKKNRNGYDKTYLNNLVMGRVSCFWRAPVFSFF